jgi:hypothetical protein
MQTQSQPKPPKRMTLESIVSERKLAPLRVLIYGPDGVGKTTFAASARDAIVLPAEDGAAYLNVARFPVAETWQDVLDALAELRGEHAHKTLVLDTLDWMEQLIVQHVCAKHKKDSLESFGYGAGYALVFDETRAFIGQLERLRAEKGMAVIGVAHSTVRAFQNPEGENFDRYELKLQAAKNNNTAALWREWSEFVLFANYETLVSDSKSGAKGESSGKRFAFTARTAAYDAKSRLALPAQLPLEWGAFARAVKEAFEKEGATNG